MKKFIFALSLILACGGANAHCEVAQSYEELKDMTVPELYQILCVVHAGVKSSSLIMQYSDGGRASAAFEKWQTCFSQEQRIERLLLKQGDKALASDVLKRCGDY